MEDFLREDDQMTIARMTEEIAWLKKEVEEKRWEAVSWGQKYDRVLDELVEVKKERDALKKENEALKKELEAKRWEYLEWAQKHDALLGGLHE